MKKVLSRKLTLLLKIFIFMIICGIFLILAQISWVKAGKLLWFDMSYHPFTSQTCTLILYDNHLVYARVGGRDMLEICATVYDKPEDANFKPKGFIAFCDFWKNNYYKTLQEDRIVFYDIQEKVFKKRPFDSYEAGLRVKIESKYTNFLTLKSDNKLIFKDAQDLFHQTFVEMSK